MQPAPDPDRRSTDLHLAFSASPSGVRDGLAHMMTTMPLCSLSDAGRGTAELVLAEVLNNIAEHAYAGQGGPVMVTLQDVPLGIGCLLVDQGAPMPGGTLPEGSQAGRTGLALADLPEGGFGWHLIRSLTRDLAYTRVAGTNRLSFLLPRDRDLS